MSADPGPLQRLWKLLYIFFLRVLYWVFSIKQQQELDDEARIDLPVNVICRGKLHTWMAKPTKSFKETDSSQPLQHSEEWAQQKADFLRSPSLKKKHMQGDTNARTKGPRVRFSDFLIEYPRTPSDECSQDLSLPPTIRIEDWSTPPSPEISHSESLKVVEAPFPPSKFVSSSSRDSLTVPSPDSPGFKRSCRTPSDRQTRVAGTGQTYRLSQSDHKLEQCHGGKNHNMRRSSLTNPPQLLKRYSEPDESTLPSLVRPARTSNSLLSSSLLDPLQTTSFPADRIDSIVQQAIQETEKQEITTVHRDRIQDTLSALQSLMGVRVSQQPQRKSNKILSVFKRHHSPPLSTRSTAPSRNRVNAAIPFPSKIGEDDLSEAKDYYRHSIDVVGIPLPMGIVLSSDVQTAILTRFHEKGLATTPERCSSGFRRQMHPPRKFHQPFTASGSGAADVPYPYVFDLDDYFQALSPTLVLEISASHNSTSQASSRNRSQDPSGTPTPSPRILSSKNALISAHVSRPTHDCRSSGPIPLPVDKRGNEYIAPKTTGHERKHLTWSSDTDEQQSLSRIEYSDESSSSGDLPLSSWVSQRLQTQGRPDKRKGFIDVIKQTGTTPEQPASSVNPDENLMFSLNSAQRVETTATKDRYFDMEQMRASLRSHYMFTRRQRNSFYERDTDDNSLASLVESYSSGSTLSHHYYPHQWTIPNVPSRYDRRLDPVIEVTSESECSNSMMTPKAAPSPRFGSGDNNIMTVDRTPPPAPPHRVCDSVNMVSCGLGLRTQSEIARETGVHRVAPCQNDGGVLTMNESAPRMQKKVTSASILTEKSTKVGMVGSKPVGAKPLPLVPPRPMGRRVAPQRF